MSQRQSEGLHLPSLLVVTAAALVAALPLLAGPGFLNTRAGGDSPFLLFRVHQLHSALAEGVFPVRWMPDAAYGYGFPFFNFYAALPFYFAAVLRFFGFSTVAALKLVQLAGFAVAAWGVYGWVRRITGWVWGAALAGAAYTFAPFHMVNVYVRGDSLSEFWAMAFYPLILWALHAAAERPTPRRVAAVALSFGALVMTHNVSALIFSPFVAVYGVGVALNADGPRRTLPLAAGGLLGVALAAWVWLPALAETSLVQLGEQTTGFFFYGNHFRTGDLLQTSFLVDYSTNPFSMGLVQAALTALGVVALIVRMQREGAWWRDGFLLAGLALSTLMITPLSEALWATLPLLDFTQFPWRFLSVQALFSAAAIGALAGEAGRWRGWVALVLALMLMAAAVSSLRLDFIPIDENDITAERLQTYEAFSGNIGTTIRYEYLPQWVAPRPYTSDNLLDRPSRAKFLSGAGEATRIRAGAHTQQWRITMTEGGEVALPLYYFPGWRAEANGQPVPLRPVEGIGYTALTLEPGTHTLDLHFGRTPARWAGDLLGVAALVTVIALWRPRIARRDRIWVAFGVTSLIVWLMVATTLPPPPPVTGHLTADFAQQAYHYPTTDPPGGEVLLSAPPPQREQGAPTLPLTPGLYFENYPQAERVTSTGEPRGALYGPPLVVQGTALIDAPQRDLPLSEAVTLRRAAIEPPYVRLEWTTERELTHNYRIALRVFDEAGSEWAALDAQAGGVGLYPTGLWQPGEVVRDAYRLPFPPGLPPGDYTLRVTLYEARTLAPLGTVTTSGVPVTAVTPAPCTDAPLLAQRLGLLSVTAPPEVAEGDPLVVEAEWQITEPLPESYQVRWALGEAWQQVTPLAVGYQPPPSGTPEPCGGLVLGRHRLTPDAPPGTYPLTATLLSAAGQPLSEPIAVGDVTLQGRQRSFEVPPLAEEVGATFGGELTLWGAEVTRGEGALTLDLTWGALADPSADYSYFVHLFDPATEAIAAQLDTMPRGFTYPTSLWVAGEVVTEQVTLDVSDVPPGRYRLAIGWYTEAGRLPAFAAAGTPLEGNRVVLPIEITIP